MAQTVGMDVKKTRGGELPQLHTRRPPPLDGSTAHAAKTPLLRRQSHERVHWRADSACACTCAWRRAPAHNSTARLTRPAPTRDVKSERAVNNSAVHASLNFSDSFLERRENHSPTPLYYPLPVPLLLTGVRHHPPGRTDKLFCRCFGAPARRVFPDHPILESARA